MTERIKILIQRRTSLKSQITNLSNLLDKDKMNNTTLKLRITRLTELYHAEYNDYKYYEEYNDEMSILDPNDAHQTEFANMQGRFYSLAGRVEDILSAAIGSHSRARHVERRGSIR